jgi:nicotinate-nucleotide adenylyltransferase
MNPRRPVVRINRPTEPERPLQPVPRRRIGLLGGSFNPAHEGHLAISREALKRLRLDRVWWLVSPQNPLKGKSDMADFARRMASAKAMAGNHRRVAVSDLEQRLGTRYTIDTVRWLKRRCRARLIWLIGADNLVQLPYWRRWRQLMALVPIAVFDREPYSYRASVGRVARAYADRRLAERAAPVLAERHPPAWVFLRLRRHQVSSTALRRQRRASHRRAGRKEESS